MSKVRVVILRVGQEPVVTEIENDFRAFGEIVGGHIDVIGLGRAPGGGRYDLIINDTGRVDRLPWNRMFGEAPIAGDVIFSKTDPYGETESLDDGDIGYIFKYLKEQTQPLKGKSFLGDGAIMINPTKDEMERNNNLDYNRVVLQQRFMEDEPEGQ